MYKARHKYSYLQKKTSAQIFSSSKLYNHIVKWVKREAKKMGLVPSAAQAVLWVEQRQGRLF